MQPRLQLEKISIVTRKQNLVTTSIATAKQNSVKTRLEKKISVATTLATRKKSRLQHDLQLKKSRNKSQLQPDLQLEQKSQLPPHLHFF